jgi:hypothetical protein
MITESTIIFAIIGMLGLFTSALVYQRTNRITSRYYASKQQHPSSDPYQQTYTD